MTLRTVGDRLNQVLTGGRCGRLLLKAAVPLFLAPILLRLADVLANADILWELDRYSFDPTIYHVRDIMTTRGILWPDFADLNMLTGVFGAALAFAGGRYKLLGSGFALAVFTYLFEPLPYWLSGNFGGELGPLSIAYVFCICAFSALSAASFRQTRRVDAESFDTPAPPAEPLKTPKYSIVLDVLAHLGALLAVGIVIAASLISALPYIGAAPRAVHRYVPNTTLAEDRTVEIPKNLRAYCYFYTNAAGNSCRTTAEPDPDGGYVIVKDPDHFTGSLSMHISYEQYLELIKLFDRYGILALDEYSPRKAQSYDLILSIFSAYGDETKYGFAIQGDGARSAAGELYAALEGKYESFGQWSVMDNEQELIPLTDFELFERQGNTAYLYRLRNARLLHVHYEDGRQTAESLDILTEAELLQLAGIVSHYDIWSAESGGGGDPAADGAAPEDYYLRISVGRENGQPVVLEYSGGVPESCAKFVSVMNAKYCDKLGLHNTMETE